MRAPDVAPRSASNRTAPHRANQLIAFYRDDGQLGRSITRFDGEVPDAYREAPIEVSITCRGLSASDASNGHFATVQLVPASNGGASSATWRNECAAIAWRTEVVMRTTAPTFVQKGVVPPLCVRGSQCLARVTRLRIAVWAVRHNGGRLVGAADVVLSDVLWAGSQDAPLTTATASASATPPRVVVRAQALARVTPPLAGALALQLSVGALRGVPRRAGVFAELLRAAPRGAWVVVARTPSRIGPGRCTPLHVPLAELCAGAPQRNLRLRVCRARAHATLACTQFTLASLMRAADSHKTLPRMRSSADGADAEVRIDKALVEDGTLLVRLRVVDAVHIAARPEVVRFGPYA